MSPRIPISTPTVQPLPRARRRFVFVVMFLFFIFAVPMFVFYATGYRYNFLDKDASITATGGLYITVGSEDGEVYLNEEIVRDMRVFRSAIYIQNLSPDIQHVHVQADGLQTWVKDLPVYPYIVTEAESFSLPTVPQIRPISEYKTSTGTPLFLGVGTSTILFDGASSSIVFGATTSIATSTLVRNSEYDFVSGLFSTSTATSTLLTRVVGEVSNALQIKNTPTETATSTATTTKRFDDLVLSKRDDDVYVSYDGDKDSVPYYFCVPVAPMASTSELYGNHVMLNIAAVLAAEASTEVSTPSERVCRSEIRIDRKWKSVIDFDFFPSSTDLIVLHKEDGVSVVEVDDRSWQNTQVLYNKPIDELVIENGRLYARSGKIIFEILTELIEVAG
jgi:hypothetical protein